MVRTAGPSCPAQSSVLANGTVRKRSAITSVLRVAAPKAPILLSRCARARPSIRSPMGSSCWRTPIG